MSRDELKLLLVVEVEDTERDGAVPRVQECQSDYVELGDAEALRSGQQETNVSRLYIRSVERIRSLFIIELDKLQFTGVAADHSDLSRGGYKDVCHELGRASIAVVQLNIVFADQARFPLFVRCVLEHKKPGVRMVGEDQNPGGITGLP